MTVEEVAGALLNRIASRRARLDEHAAIMRARPRSSRVRVSDDVRQALNRFYSANHYRLSKLTPEERDIWRWQNDPDWCGPWPSPRSCLSGRFTFSFSAQ